MHRLFLLSLAILAIASVIIAQPKTIRVPQDHATIQAAINAAVNGDTVLVSEGTYQENLMLAKKIVLGSLFLTDNVTSHISGTIIDGGFPQDVDLGSVILVLIGTDTSTVIKGFTLQNGRGSKYPGANFIHGGGIAILGGGATISDNIIKNNTCTSSTYATGAAGIDIEPDPSNVGPAPWAITNNTIINNVSTSTAPSGAGTVDGGGIALTGLGRVSNNTIANNAASGRVYGAGGGVAVYSFIKATDIDFSNNTVASNVASAGGGINMWVNVPYYQMKVSFSNNLIVGNSAFSGAAIAVNSGNYTWKNNTIANNLGWEAVKLSKDRGSLAFGLMNNIMWNPGSTVEINSLDYATAQYNCIRDGYPGVGNFSANPLFTPDGSYQLSDSSYCIGRGMDSVQIGGVWYAAPTRDLNGNSRPIPSGSFSDVGAVEHASGTSRPLPWQPVAIQFMSGGKIRSCLVEIPFAFASQKNLPVVFSLNGYGGDALTQHNYIRTHILGDSVGYITVYPEAYQKRWNSGISANPATPAPNVDDVAFISAIIDTLIARYAIDATRVYACGMSNGGMMSLRLAGQLSHRIAAVASVGGTMSTISAATYSATLPVPVMLVHGTADITIPYIGGVTNIYSVAQTVDFWKGKNACTLPADTLKVPNRNMTDNSTVEVYTYESDRNSTQVKLYKIIGGGHEWPGAASYPGATTINRDIDVNKEIWDFFKQFTLTNRYIGGEILALAPNGSTMFAGTTEGIYRTADLGVTWSLVGAPSRSIFALAVGPDDAGGTAVFAATADSVFRSTDNGNTWMPATTGLNVFRGNQFLLGSWIQSLMFGSNQNGTTDLYTVVRGPEAPDLFHSTDQGTSWTSLKSMLPGHLLNNLYSAIVIDSNIFVWDFGDIHSAGESYVSSDRGNTWTSSGLIAQSIVQRPVHLTGVSHPTTFFHNGGGLYRVTFNGTNWTSRLVEFNDRQVGTVAAHVTSGGDTTIVADVYQTGGTGHSILASTDNGSTWREVPGSPNFVPNPMGSYALAIMDDGLKGMVGGQNGIFTFSLLTTDVTDGRKLPTEFSLLQNFPNPFNPATEISYVLPFSSHVSLVVYDLLGREVSQLVNEEMPAGSHTATWNASDMPSGMYFYKLTTDTFTQTRKMLLLR